MTYKTCKISDYESREEYLKAGYSENWDRPQITLDKLNEIVSEANGDDGELFSVLSREDWLQSYGDRIPSNEIERTGKGDLLAVLVADWDSEVYYLEVRTKQRRENEIWVDGGKGSPSICVTYAVWDGVEDEIDTFIASNQPDDLGEAYE